MLCGPSEQILPDHSLQRMNHNWLAILLHLSCQTRARHEHWSLRRSGPERPRYCLDWLYPGAILPFLFWGQDDEFRGWHGRRRHSGGPSEASRDLGTQVRASASKRLDYFSDALEFGDLSVDLVQD